MKKHKHKKTTIELNGKIYDPRTGKQIGADNPMPRPSAPVQSIDGVISPSGANQQNNFLAPQSPPPTAAKPKTNSQRPEPKHAARQVHKSQTLARTGVKKPAAKKHSPAKREQAPAKNIESVFHASLQERSERAREIQKSRLIQKFNQSQSPAQTPKATAQTKPMTATAAPKPAHVQPYPEHHLASVSHRGNNQNSPRRHSIKDFEDAVKNATSHLEKMPKKSRKKLSSKTKKANIAFASLAVVMLMGFFAWQNTPNLQMRLAASRAQIPASMPGYSPSGYGVSGGIKAEPGSVTVSFQSRTNDKGFSLTQQASNWNSEALYANHVQHHENQTYQTDDKTIYLVNDSNATWVDNGIWYTIEGNADLTTDQLQRIANSL